MTKKILGKKHFGPHITITDPCYDRDVWCRIDKVPVKEGIYNCYVEMDEHEDCIAAVGIELPEADPERCISYIASVGVDAGLCGIFNSKPDMKQKEWEAWLAIMWAEEKKTGLDAHLWNNVNGTDGVFSESGYGDGVYDVFAEENENGEIIAVKIVFIEDDEDEDYDEDEDEDYDEEEDF